MSVSVDRLRSQVDEAYGRIRQFVRHTPLEYSPALSRLTGGKVFLKCENFQLTGSFKIRGVMNALLSLREKQKQKELITASSGNHGSAFAYAAWKLGLQARVFLPTDVAPVKVAALRQWGAKVEFVGDDCVKAEMAARSFAEERNVPFISPYNDARVMAGQGTIALEINKELPQVDILLAPVGGGGLISGIGAVLKTMAPPVEMIGCQPQNSAVMFHSLRAGKILDLPSLPTLSDGTAGGIEPDTITFPICRQCVDDFILLSEREIANAIRFIVEAHHMLAEGAGVLSIAAIQKEPARFRNKTVVAVISGAKISPASLGGILAGSNSR